MPVYEVQGPDGRIFEVDSPRPPTANDVKRYMSRMAHAETHRPIPPGADPRDLSLEFDQPEIDDASKLGAAGLGLMGGFGAAPGAAIGMARAAMHPVGAGVIGAGLNYAHTGDPISAAEAGFRDALFAKAAPAVLGRFLPGAAAAQEAKAAATAAATATETAPQVQRAFQGVPAVMKIGREAEAATDVAKAARGASEASNLLKMPIRLPAESASAVAAKAAEAATTATKAAPKAAKAARKAASVVDSKAKHSALVKFAKEIAEKDPRVGEKIWIELDDAGMPIRRLTSDQAAAAARKGTPHTWFKNLWSSGQKASR